MFIFATINQTTGRVPTRRTERHQDITDMDKIIGFDAKRLARNASGLGNYGRTLINALAPLDPHLQLRLYAPDAGRDDLRSQVTTAPNVVWCFPEGRPLRLQRDLWRAHGIVADLRRDGVSVFHGLTGELPAGLRQAGIKGVVTIHDLIFLRHPEYYHAIDVWLYKRKFRRTLREADRVVAISECTKRDILHYSDYPADRIDVIYQSCDRRYAQPVPPERLQEVRRRYALPARYVLSVGTIEERKNTLLACRALTRLPEDVHLVLVGRRTPYADKVESEARRLGVGDRLRLLSGVPTDDLLAIYRLATCFVYPSRYEGFGIPIIEAIQSGLPVVACTGSCLEEAGGPDSLYVGPDDVEGMAQAIGQLLGDNRERVARSQSYVARFENSNVAGEIRDVLLSV
jgi:glycosyltransferase involved in cell wall biosynthesis